MMSWSAGHHKGCPYTYIQLQGIIKDAPTKAAAWGGERAV